MVADVFRQNCELRITVIAFTGGLVELRDEYLGDMVLFVGFIHDVRSDMLADGRIEISSSSTA